MSGYRKIRQKYIVIDDNQFIADAIGYIGQKTNMPIRLKSYVRNEHHITIQIHVNGRIVKLKADATKSDIQAEIDRKLRHIQ